MTEANPQILVNGERRERQPDDGEASVCADVDCSEVSAAETEAQAKMQSAFQQVRKQIRSQAGNKAMKSSMVELVQKVRDMEMEMVQPEGKGVDAAAQTRAGPCTDEGAGDGEVAEGELCAAFEKKLAASQKALKDAFEEQISQMRREMRAYTDHALRDLERKMQQSPGPDKKPKPAAAPAPASRRGRLLTRTMTTITPKTCAPVVMGPRAKSETLTSAKGESARLLPRDVALLCPGNRPHQGRRPLPPACPPLHQRKKPAQAKAKAKAGK